MRALMARKADDMDALTATVATAVSISLSPDAHAKWMSARRADHRPTSAAIDAQNGTIGRLAAMFPGAVRVSH
jgi:hypothetical protein